jgi:hypothetical protein
MGHGVNLTSPLLRASQRLLLTAPVLSVGAGMTLIPGLEVYLQPGWYHLEFHPHYNVSATNVGTGWNFQGGSAVLTDYAFRSWLPSTATAAYFNAYASRSQNFTTAQTSRAGGNRGRIEADFRVVGGGTLVPHFRSETAGGLVTLLPGSFLRVDWLGG